MIALKSVAGCIAFLLAALAPSIHAQTYPARAVRVITPFPAGSGPDAVLRMVGAKLSGYWGQPLLVENRPGANGFIAFEAAKGAAPDGYTLVQMDDAHMAAQPHLFKKLPYNLREDFEPAAALFRTYFFVVVPAASTWKNVGDLVAAARGAGGRLTYGSWFIGSPGHIGAAMLEAAAGISMTHILYKDLGQLYNAVGNNEIGWAFGTAASAGPALRGGRVRFLAVAAPSRVAGYREVPTVREADGPSELVLQAWVALLAPRGAPPAAIARINADVARALAEADVRERYAAFAFEPYAPSPAEILAAIESDSRRYQAIISRARISLD